jgi:hypothetical protein
VGSWFFISATSKVRKSFAVIVVLSADVEVEVEEAAPLVLLVDPEDEVLGFASALATLVAELASCGLLVTTC